MHDSVVFGTFIHLPARNTVGFFSDVCLLHLHNYVYIVMYVLYSFVSYSHQFTCSCVKAGHCLLASVPSHPEKILILKSS